MRALIAAIRSLLSRGRFEREMREELAVHLLHRADELVATGVSREEALRQARLEFGAVEACKEKCRDASGFAPMRTHGLGADFRMAGRRLLATPMFTIFAVLSLAVGVGVTTAVYSVVSATFWKRPAVAEPEQLVFVMMGGSLHLTPERMSRPDYEDLRASLRSLNRISASAAIFPAVASPASTDLLPGEAVDGAYFRTLGISAALGRTVDSSDDQTAAKVVVLSHWLWRTKFAADRNVVGQVVRLSGQPFEIVGVARESFDGLHGWSQGARLWVPASVAPIFPRAPTSIFPERDRRVLTVFGRLQPGSSVQSVAAELAAFASNLDATYPQRGLLVGAPVTSRQWSAKSLADRWSGDSVPRRLGFVLVGLVALVLVVASMNLSNLVLARGIVRRRELAVRLALGASRWRLVREQLAESTLLALVGGLASWLVLQSLRWVLDIELPLGGRFTLTLQPTLNLAALTTASVALLLSLLVFGLEPALQLTRGRGVRNDLAAGAGSVGVPRAQRQRALLRWQVAISAGFFIIATLFIRQTIAEMRHDTGIEMDRLAVAVLNFDTQRWDEARVRRVLGRAMEEAGQQPSVEAVAVSTGLPFGVAGQMSIGIGTPDNAGDPNRLMPAAAIAASPSLFRTIGVPIVRGRGFDDRDHAGAAAVVVLTERTARKLFGTIDAAGRRILVQRQRTRTTQPPTTATVIGVARDTDTGHVFGNRGDLVYLPFSQHYDASMTLTARSTGDLALAVRAVRVAIRRADPDLAVEASGTGRAMLVGPYVFLRGAGLGALSLGALTLLLAMVGLFGIQSHMVAQRTREIGVRMSFGATAVNIRRMVLKDGYAPVVQGLAIGVFIGLAGRAIVRSYLDVKVDILDPWMLLAVPIPLLLAAFCACYLPAHRASRVDPNVALRHL